MTKQPDLTVTIQSRHPFLFGHIACIDDDADAKMILTAPPSENWRGPAGHTHITWLNTVQRDLRTHNLALNEAVDLAQNCLLMSTFGTMHSQRCMPEKKKKKAVRSASMICCWL